MKKNEQNPNKLTIDHEIEEMKRELAMRRRVYPGMVMSHKLTRAEMNHRYDVVEAIISRLEKIKLEIQGVQSTIFE